MSCTINATALAGGLMPTAATPPTTFPTPQFAPTTPTAAAVAGANGGAVSSLGGGGTAVAGAAAAIGTSAIAPILTDLTAAITKLSATLQPILGAGAPSATSGGGQSGNACFSQSGGSGATGAPIQEAPLQHRSTGRGDSPVGTNRAPARPPATGAGSADAGKWLTGDVKGLDPDLTEKLATLGARLGQRLTIVSGNRTYEEQAALYKKYLAGTGNLAAKPGTSNHEHGDAADVNINGKSLAKDPKAKQLALELGLHFPVRGEPWHVEVK